MNSTLDSQDVQSGQILSISAPYMFVYVLLHFVNIEVFDFTTWYRQTVTYFGFLELSTSNPCMEKHPYISTTKCLAILTFALNVTLALTLTMALKIHIIHIDSIYGPLNAQNTLEFLNTMEFLVLNFRIHLFRIKFSWSLCSWKFRYFQKICMNKICSENMTFKRLSRFSKYTFYSCGVNLGVGQMILTSAFNTKEESGKPRVIW